MLKISDLLAMASIRQQADKLYIFRAFCHSLCEFMRVTGFCPRRALEPFALKNRIWPKKPQMAVPDGAAKFSNQKMMKSDFRNIVAVY